MNLQEVRVEYINGSLDLEDLKKSPFEQLSFWMDQALKAEISYPNAVQLATVDKDGFPNSRTVLIKEILEDGVIFYSDYTSTKAEEIRSSRKVAITFFWKELDRQVRIQGHATKIDPEKSEKYFLSRPIESQISALASNQSSPVSKEELISRVKNLKEQYKEKTIPYPNNWGGYIVSFDKVEFWQGRPNRLHDRFQFISKNNSWEKTRLAP